MKPTEELCKRFDEIGIEHRSYWYENYVWWDGKDGVCWHAEDNGSRVSIGAVITPEQAIAATVGETCKQEEQGWSTEGDHARVWLTCGHDCMVPTVADLPNFCPECGAKVVAE